MPQPAGRGKGADVPAMLRRRLTDALALHIFRSLPRALRAGCSQRRGRSSVGRASRSQCEGQGFDSPRLHQSSPGNPRDKKVPGKRQAAGQVPAAAASQARGRRAPSSGSRRLPGRSSPGRSSKAIPAGLTSIMPHACRGTPKEAPGIILRINILWGGFLGKAKPGYPKRTRPCHAALTAFPLE